jgi:serine/threonine protein phosphatase PrpC
MAEQPADKLTLPFPFRWAAVTDIGKVRDENQDAYVVEPELQLFMVSDGMGGHRGGAIASKIIAEDLPPMIENKLDQLKSRSSRAVRSLLKRAVGEQSRQLRMEGASESGYKEMGATVAVALIVGGRAYVANLGDSRAYRFRNGRLRQLSRDHSVISELLEEGQIRQDEVEDHVARGQITHYIGMEEKAWPHVRSFVLNSGDRLLLCTDGLTDLVNDIRIAAILEEKSDCQTACEALVEAVNAAGATDNVTVVVVDWPGRSPVQE